MDRPELTLVPDRPARRERGVPAAALAAAVLLAAAAGAAGGARAARAPFDPSGLAETALASSWAGGGNAPVARALAALRARLARFPDDAATRTILASLMLESMPDERAAVVDQVRRAVRDDPYGVGVRRAAARIDARLGRTDDAIAELRAIFRFDAGAGSEALADVEPLLPPDRVDEAIPDDPDAWRSWSVRLRERGRAQEADARLAALIARWPDDLRARAMAGNIAAGRGRIDDLLRAVPPDLAVPDTADDAPLIALRARSRIATGDAAGGRRDAARAVQLSNGAPWVLVAAGDALRTTDPAAARRWWTRAAFALSDAPGRAWVVARLARLDEREGRAADALRRWREVLAVQPGNGEAARRVAALTGGGS